MHMLKQLPDTQAVAMQYPDWNRPLTLCRTEDGLDFILLLRMEAWRGLQCVLPLLLTEVRKVGIYSSDLAEPGTMLNRLGYY